MGQMTLGECKNRILQLINQYSVAGATVALSYNNQADYIARIVPLINDAQMEIAKTVRRIPTQFVITQAPVENLCNGRGLIIHGNEDVVASTSYAPARSYYFEVDGPANVYVEELVDGEWVVVATHNITPPEPGFISVRGMAGSGKGLLRFRLSGEFPYMFKNDAFYKYVYADATDIPEFGDYVEYELPDDYYQLNGRGVPYYSDGGEFVMSHKFRWLGAKTLLLDRSLVGEFLVDYFRYPERIPDGAPDSLLLDNTPDTHEAIPYLVASMLCAQDNANLSSTLYNIFETRISRLNEATFSENLEVDDVYGFGAGMGGV